MPAIDTAIIAAAQRNRGLVTRQQLRDLGATRWVLSRHVDSGMLRPVASRVFIVAGHPWDRRHKILAAHLQAGERSVVSHATAAEAWGFPGLGLSEVEVTIPRGTPRPAKGIGRLHRSRDLGRADVLLVDGTPYTNAARTLLDLAARLRPSHLERCLRHACHEGLTSCDDVLALIEEVRRPGRPGIRRLLPLVEAALSQPVTESWLEARFLDVLREHGVPMPETQVEVDVDGHRYRLDALWRPQRLVVELDGHAAHKSRSARQHAAERSARLIRAGYTVITFTYDDIVDRPRYAIAMTMSYLAAQRAA